MQNAEYLTTRYCQWESRGRGWVLSDEPIDLEPPFIPYVRNVPQYSYIDDGKRHTLISKAIQFIKRAPPTPVRQELLELDYNSIEPFIYDDDNVLYALQLKFSKDRRIPTDTLRALLVMLSYTEHPLSFEIIGTHTEIIIQFVCRDTDKAVVQTYI